MNRKILSVFITILILLSILLITISSCCLPVKKNTSSRTRQVFATITVPTTTTAPTTTIAKTTIAETTLETNPVGFYKNIDDKIRFIIEEGMFPDSWYDEPINAKAESLNPEEIKRTRSIIIKALKKYPDEVLIKNLSKVYVLSELEFYGVGFGGTNSDDSVYLTNIDYSNIWIETAFHQEFSSIFLRSYKSLFDKQAWIRINPGDFIYFSDTGVEALKKGQDSTIFDPKLNEIGFLYEYAQSTPENDFNSFAENIFMNDSYFWEAIDKYPKLKEKFDLIVKFYNSINPIFTEEYFRKISQE